MSSEKVQVYDNRCVLSDYVYASEEASLSIASGAALIGYLWNNSKPMRPNGLVNKVNKDERKGSSLLAMQDAIDDACKFSWNRRDAEYKNFRYALDTNKPRGRKLRKCFS
jgi:hypothetical protein